ncbi:hypothetical protein [Gluconobacter oxydans]|uniref:Uncharacterized protein n=1 Tax=Gluconobacter oxydans TaxID=442 RepID=A0A149RRT3_GLUOY|nr:hypothetical protein [Gluconobacter oxydans]KXV17106.1 hypothetical protein AD934_12605 [Gluconobacter oxydans]
MSGTVEHIELEGFRPKMLNSGARLRRWSSAMCEKCCELLSQGLDLCVRARKLDEIDRRNNFLAASVCPDEWQKDGLFDKFIERWNAMNSDRQCSTKSGTIALWVQEQYEADLAEWERKGCHHLMQGCLP